MRHFPSTSLVLLGALACGGVRKEPPASTVATSETSAAATPSGGRPVVSRVLTAEQIATMGGVANAYDVLRRGTFPLRVIESRDGKPARITRQRGTTSLTIAGADATAIVVDGTVSLDPTMLRTISAPSIERMELLDAR